MGEWILAEAKGLFIIIFCLDKHPGGSAEKKNPKTFNNLYSFGINSILLFFFYVLNGPTIQTCSIGASGCSLSKTYRGVDGVYLKERGVNIQRGRPRRTPQASECKDAIRTERDALRPARKTQLNIGPPFLLFSSPSSHTEAEERWRRREINGRANRESYRGLSNNLPTCQETTWQTLQNATDESDVIGSRFWGPGNEPTVCVLTTLQELQRTEVHQTRLLGEKTRLCLESTQLLYARH